MISVESMRVVLLAARQLLNRRKSRCNAIEWDIKMREQTITSTKSAGAATRAQNEIKDLQARLGEWQALVLESETAIAELVATDVGKSAEQSRTEEP